MRRIKFLILNECESKYTHTHNTIIFISSTIHGNCVICSSHPKLEIVHGIVNAFFSFSSKISDICSYVVCK